MKKNIIFTQEKPLLGFVTWRANKYILEYSHFNKPDGFTNNNLFVKGKLPEQDYEVVFNCKATKEELQKCDFLRCFEIAGRQFITHKRNLEIFKQNCPASDYLTMRVIIQHSGKEDKTLISDDFVFLFIQNYVDAVSDKSFFRRSDLPDGDELVTITKIVLQKNCMEIHRLALDRYIGPLGLFHPDLAYQLRKCKNIKFYTDEQWFKASYPNGVWEEEE